MRFGIYAEMQCPDDKPCDKLYSEIFRQMVHADEVGFDAYSTIEHHFFQNFGISANPLALFTAVAQLFAEQVMPAFRESASEHAT